MKDLLFEIVHPIDSEYVDHIFYGSTRIPLKHPEQKSMYANLTIRALPFKGHYAVFVGDTRRRLLTLNTPSFNLHDLCRQTRDLNELASILLPGGGVRIRGIRSEKELPIYLNTIYRTKLPIDTPANVIQVSLHMALRGSMRVKNGNTLMSHKSLYLYKPEPLKYLEYKDGLLFNSRYSFPVSDLGFDIEESAHRVIFASGTVNNPIVITEKLEMGEVDGSVIWKLVYERIKADIDHRLQFVLNNDTNEAWEVLSGHVIGVPNKLTWEDVFNTYLDNHQI